MPSDNVMNLIYATHRIFGKYGTSLFTITYGTMFTGVLHVSSIGSKYIFHYFYGLYVFHVDAFWNVYIKNKYLLWHPLTA